MQILKAFLALTAVLLGVTNVVAQQAPVPGPAPQQSAIVAPQSGSYLAEAACGGCSAAACGGGTCASPAPQLGVFAEPGCGWQPGWSVTTEALFLHLSRANYQPLVISNTILEPVLATSDLGQDLVAGPRVSLVRRLQSGGAIEVAYFGFHHWDTSAAVIWNDQLSLPGALGPATVDFSAASMMTAHLSADLHNAEINVIRPIVDHGMFVLAGFRYVNLGEQFNLEAEQSLGGASNYQVSVDNNLFGCQIGAGLRRERGRFGLEILGKGGVFGNDTQQRTFLGDVDNTIVLRDTYDREGQVSFVGEVGITASMQLGETFAFRVGYNMFWLEGVARATDQLDFSNTDQSSTWLSNDGDAFLHGLSLGLEGKW